MTIEQINELKRVAKKANKLNTELINYLDAIEVCIKDTAITLEEEKAIIEDLKKLLA